MESILKASTPAEAEMYFRVHPCPACKRGPWQLLQDTEADLPGRLKIQAQCMQCKNQEDFIFEIRSQGGDQQGWQINPDPTPSELIDLAGWLSLFYSYLDQADKQTDKAASRRLGYQAAVCLAESLKFYDDQDELPPAGAFFTETGRAAYREHTEGFARQKLRDMQSKLPALQTMASRLAQEARASTDKPQKRWWQFWR